jgi:hypothetical protein
MRGAACLAANLLAAGLSVGPLAARGLAGGGTEPVTRLGTDGTRFTVNDRPAFLFGVSYYGEIGAPDETVRRDLADLKKHGFNWVRVWATWAAFGEDVSAVDGEGTGCRLPCAVTTLARRPRDIRAFLSPAD